MRKIYRIILLTLLLSLCSAGSVAAKYQQIPSEGKKVGSYSMWLDGRRLCIKKAGSSKVTSIKNVDAAISDGKTVYISRIQRSTSNRKTQLLKYSIAKKKISRLTVLKGDYRVFDMNCERLLLDDFGMGFPGITVYSLKTKKLTEVSKETVHLGSYRQYNLFRDYNGGIGPVSIWVYNSKTNKAKLALKGVDRSFVRVKNQIYYLYDLNSASDPYARTWHSGRLEMAVYRYSLTTGKKKALTEKICLKQIVKFTKNKLVYLGWDNQSHTIWY